LSKRAASSTVATAHFRQEEGRYRGCEYSDSRACDYVTLFQPSGVSAQIAISTNDGPITSQSASSATIVRSRESSALFR